MRNTLQTAQEFIDLIEQEEKELLDLELALKIKRNEIAKTLAKLRAYKKRGVVTKISKYKYIVNNNYKYKKGE
jgi:hypothetical protein